MKDYLIKGFDFLDQFGRRIGNIFSRLDKMTLGHRVGCFRGGEAASVTQRARMLGDDGGRRQHLLLATAGARQRRTSRLNRLSNEMGIYKLLSKYILGGQKDREKVRSQSKSQVGNLRNLSLY